MIQSGSCISLYVYNIWLEVVTVLYWWLHNEYIVMLMILHFRDVFISMQSRKPPISPKCKFCCVISYTVPVTDPTYLS